MQQLLHFPLFGNAQFEWAKFQRWTVTVTMTTAKVVFLFEILSKLLRFIHHFLLQNRRDHELHMSEREALVTPSGRQENYRHKATCSRERTPVLVPLGARNRFSHTVQNISLLIKLLETTTRENMDEGRTKTDCECSERREGLTGGLSTTIPARSWDCGPADIMSKRFCSRIWNKPMRKGTWNKSNGRQSESLMENGFVHIKNLSFFRLETGWKKKKAGGVVRDALYSSSGEPRSGWCSEGRTGSGPRCGSESRCCCRHLQTSSTERGQRVC